VALHEKNKFRWFKSGSWKIKKVTIFTSENRKALKISRCTYHTENMKLYTTKHDESPGKKGEKENNYREMEIGTAEEVQKKVSFRPRVQVDCIHLMCPNPMLGVLKTNSPKTTVIKLFFPRIQIKLN
jgi:hypothetical protein